MSKIILSKFWKRNKKINIIIVFTFVDDFNEILTLTSLIDKDSPFFNIYGNINQLPHFKFNNKAYFINDKKFFTRIFDKKNFNNLLKYIYELKSISFESRRKVIIERFLISNYINNLSNE